ncbi:MAG TPA: glutamyl-tRNA amidotransferase, partial [Roseovarius sp.]|nr:glutamyl-tRNA amidotransferase [Roseovarius sp.]
MELRDRIGQALKQAMKDKDQSRLATLRLINAAIKDLEIANRGSDDAAALGDAEIRAILAKMVKQRNESVRAYEEGGRVDLAERERAEIAVIEEFLP